MESQEDLVIDIPKERMRFFGGAGKMLLPSPATVATLIEKVPEHNLITTRLLCQELTNQFKVKGTCPVTTRKAVQAIAHDPTKKVPYWRVIQANGALISRLPGGVDGQTTLLRKEGFVVDRKGKVAKVKNFRERLVRFH